MHFHSILSNSNTSPTSQFGTIAPVPSANVIGSRTIYIGDLSIYCTEADISQLFLAYGPIESVHLRRATAQLAYGFVRFKHRHSAENALMSMQGNVFMGRSLRLGWAEDTRNLNPQSGSNNLRSGPLSASTPPAFSLLSASTTTNLTSPVLSTSPSHAQVHVTFLSNHLKIVTESFLRILFENFGEVVDVSIKKLHVSKETGQQSGYGFVHYHLNDLGLTAATQAVNHLNEKTVDSIFFRCSFSRGLMNYLKERENINTASLPDRVISKGSHHMFHSTEVRRPSYPGYFPVLASNFHDEADSFSVNHLIHQSKTHIDGVVSAPVLPPAAMPVNDPFLTLPSTRAIHCGQRVSLNSMNSSMTSTIPNVPRGSFSSYETGTAPSVFPETPLSSLEQPRFHP